MSLVRCTISIHYTEWVILLSERIVRFSCNKNFDKLNLVLHEKFMILRLSKAILIFIPKTSSLRKIKIKKKRLILY